MAGYTKVIVQDLVHGPCVQPADAHAGQYHRVGLPGPGCGRHCPPGGLVSGDHATWLEQLEEWGEVVEAITPTWCAVGSGGVGDHVQPGRSLGCQTGPDGR